jgi:RES domain-containing protein
LENSLSTKRRIHDRRLLDKLESVESATFNGSLWRVCWDGTNPLTGSTAGGRWHPADSIEGLYTSTSYDVAVAEVHYHLLQQPVYSSAHKLLWEITAQLDRVLNLNTPKILSDMKVSSDDPASSQKIGAATHFLEYQAIIIPSLRWHCTNLLIFPEYLDFGEDLTVAETPHEINWPAWIEKNRIPRGIQF